MALTGGSRQRAPRQVQPRLGRAMLVLGCVLATAGVTAMDSPTTGPTPSAAPPRPTQASAEEPDTYTSVEAWVGLAAATAEQVSDAPDDPDRKPAATEEIPANSGSGKRVVLDLTAQQVWLVDDDGSEHRSYMVSASRYDNLDPGTYEVFSTSRHAVSWNHTETMEYMVRFTRGENANIGFHDIPVSQDSGEEVQTLSELGTPLSDGCIRQDVEDAEALWDFATVGTEVVVVRT